MEKELPRSARNRRVPDRYSPLPFKTTPEKNISEYKEQSSNHSNKNEKKVSDKQSESAEQIEDIQSEAQVYCDSESSIDYPEATDHNLDFHFDTEFIMGSVEDVTVMPMRSVSMVRLTRWQDYPLWFDQIKLWAKKHEIWDMVNPSIKEPQIYPIRPSIPGEPENISDAEQRAIWQIRNSVYQQKRQE
ncbi:hypothetical protein K3495_g10613 [Podosphaera aphanis]|nr:hypothetical protein K3495_g10613 [Podosphaera aphanis]